MKMPLTVLVEEVRGGPLYPSTAIYVTGIHEDVTLLPRKLFNSMRELGVYLQSNYPKFKPIFHKRRTR